MVGVAMMVPLGGKRRGGNYQNQQGNNNKFLHGLNVAPVRFCG